VGGSSVPEAKCGVAALASSAPPRKATHTPASRAGRRFRQPLRLERQVLKRRTVASLATVRKKGAACSARRRVGVAPMTAAIISLLCHSYSTMRATIVRLCP
jgi:hypothetical protein